MYYLVESEQLRDAYENSGGDFLYCFVYEYELTLYSSGGGFLSYVRWHKLNGMYVATFSVQEHEILFVQT
jgi:hypothetical protein